MKKVLAATVLITLSFGLFIEPTYAILDKKTNSQVSILDEINYDWWKKLNDKYLENYITTALEKNNDIKTAKLKIEQAKLNVTMQRANQLPELSVGVAPMETKMPMTTKGSGSIAIPIMASYEFDIFGKNWDKTKSAKKMLKSSEYQAQVADIAIVSYVGSTYYNIVKLDKIISLQEELTKNRENIYNLMKLSNKEGLVSTSDLILAEKNYVLAQNDLIEYKKSLEQALNALAVLIGDSPNNTKEYKRISFDNLASNFNIPNEIASEIIINRPDYKAIEKQLEAKGIDIRIAKKEFLPTIDILGLVSFVAQAHSSMNWQNALGLFGANATLPIFTGFRRVANLKLNKNAYEQILEQYQKTNLVALQEVNDALYNLKSDNEKLINNTKALEIQKQDYSFSNSKYNKGVISKLDLLQQKEALIFIEKLYTSSKVDCYIDKISLYKTTGAKI